MSFVAHVGRYITVENNIDRLGHTRTDPGLSGQTALGQCQQPHYGTLDWTITLVLHCLHETFFIVFVGPGPEVRNN